MVSTLISCLVLAFAVVGVLGRSWPCQSEAECNYDECCVLAFTGEGKVCRKFSKKVGAPCGGDYFCPECGKNLVCTPLEPSASEQMEAVTEPTEEGIIAKTISLVFNSTSEPTPEQETCTKQHPANGTCQQPPPLPEEPGTLEDEL